jgi:hypothetical protein
MDNLETEMREGLANLDRSILEVSRLSHPIPMEPVIVEPVVEVEAPAPESPPDSIPQKRTKRAQTL